MYITKKALRLMYFVGRLEHTGPLFKDLTILKLYDKVYLENCKFVSKSLKYDLPFVLNNRFSISTFSHDHFTRASSLGYLKVPFHNTKAYGRYSIITNSVYIWNYIQSQNKEVLLHTLSYNKLKDTLTKYFIKKYI